MQVDEAWFIAALQKSIQNFANDVLREKKSEHNFLQKRAWNDVSAPTNHSPSHKGFIKRLLVSCNDTSHRWMLSTDNSVVTAADTVIELLFTSITYTMDFLNPMFLNNKSLTDILMLSPCTGCKFKRLHKIP